MSIARRSRCVPEFHDIRTKYAMALRQAGQTDEAIAELERVREENPRFIAVRLNLGLAYLAQGRRHDAEREWQAVLSREPNNKMGSPLHVLARFASK